MLYEPPLDRDKRPSDNVVVGGDWWTLHRANLRKDIYGVTHHDERLIEIDHRLKGRIELDTIVHEFYHAVYPWLTEHAIDQSATELAQILWKLGYRKVKP